MICYMRILLLLLLIPLSLIARPKLSPTILDKDIPYAPWFTGPLLAPTPVNMVPGHPAIEPVLGVFNTYGRYDSNWKLKGESSTWTINPLVDYQFAFNKTTGLEVIVSYETTFREGKTSSQFDDTLLFFGYQISNDIRYSWVPDLRLFFEITTPSGNHDQLDPSLEGIDISGQGAFFFGPNLTFQKLYYFPNSFFLLHCSFGYSFPTEAHIRDQSVYGGVKGTKGRIRPGEFLIAFFSGEYSLNQRWVFQFDTEFFYQRAASRFKGRTGFNPDGTPAEVGLPASLQINLAPGLEYNFTPDTGLLFGAYFSLAGFNTEAFASLYFGLVHIF